MINSTRQANTHLGIFCRWEEIYRRERRSDHTSNFQNFLEQFVDASWIWTPAKNLELPLQYRWKKWLWKKNFIFCEGEKKLSCSHIAYQIEIFKIWKKIKNVLGVFLFKLYKEYNLDKYIWGTFVSFYDNSGISRELVLPSDPNLSRKTGSIKYPWNHMWTWCYLSFIEFHVDRVLSLFHRITCGEGLVCIWWNHMWTWSYLSLSRKGSCLYFIELHVDMMLFGIQRIARRQGFVFLWENHMSTWSYLYFIESHVDMVLSLF